METVFVEVWRERKRLLRVSIFADQPNNVSIIWDHCFESLPPAYRYGVWVKNKKSWEEMIVLLKVHGLEPKILKEYSHA